MRNVNDVRVGDFVIAKYRVTTNNPNDSFINVVDIRGIGWTLEKSMFEIPKPELEVTSEPLNFNSFFTQELSSINIEFKK